MRPGTQRSGKTLAIEPPMPTLIEAEPGDVLMMRPLLEHASRKAHPKSTAPRGIVHLEFGAKPELPEGYRWREFIPL